MNAESGSGPSASTQARSANPKGGEIRTLLRRDEVATGKQVFVFSSGQANDLKEWAMRGTPVAEGDFVYIGASKSNQPQELHLLAVYAKDGKLELVHD